MLKKRRILFLIIVIFILCILINNIKIFSIYSGDYEFLFNKYLSQVEKSEEICIVRFRENKWFVEKTSCPSLENKNVNIDFYFNPLDLRMSYEENFKDVAKYVILFNHNEDETNCFVFLIITNGFA